MDKYLSGGGLERRLCRQKNDDYGTDVGLEGQGVMPRFGTVGEDCVVP